jgi:DNA-binding NarL/FixJ family response regulator
MIDCRPMPVSFISNLQAEPSTGHRDIFFIQIHFQVVMTDQTERLTHPERSCLQSVARGQTPIAATQSHEKFQKTGNDHLASARRKLLASTTIEAVARAMKMGLIE